jgi:hypothetical protein
MNMKILNHIHELICLSIFLIPIGHILQKHDWSIEWVMSAF